MYVTNDSSGKKGVAIGIDGKLVYAKDPFMLDFEVQGTGFPHGIFRLVNDGYERSTVMVDFDDGTPLKEMQLTQNMGITHYYQDLVDASKIGTSDPNYPQRRTIKFYPKKPREISGLVIIYYRMFGALPENLGNYNLLHSLNLNGTQFTEFPIYFKGFKSNYLDCNNAYATKIYSLPEWIYNSLIKEINLGDEFDFNLPPNESKLDSMVNNTSLVILRLRNVYNESIPSNFVNISTLRTLSMGRGKYTKLPTNVSNLTQLTALLVSQSVDGHTTSIQNWGDGIGNLVNLTSLYYHGATSITSDLPLGLGNCWKIKTIYAQRNFQRVGGSSDPVVAQYHTDRHIDQYYDCVNINGDNVVTTNNKFRNVLFEFGEYPDKRPSGMYQQPSGFVLGSNNGTPTTPMEKIWVLVNQYKWKIRVTLPNSVYGNELLQ